MKEKFEKKVIDEYFTTRKELEASNSKLQKNQEELDDNSKKI